MLRKPTWRLALDLDEELASHEEAPIALAERQLALRAILHAGIGLLLTPGTETVHYRALIRDLTSRIRDLALSRGRWEANTPSTHAEDAARDDRTVTPGTSSQSPMDDY